MQALCLVNYSFVGTGSGFSESQRYLGAWLVGGGGGAKIYIQSDNPGLAPDFTTKITVSSQLPYMTSFRV